MAIGMNVIGSADGWWRDRPGAMRELVEELDAFASARRAGDVVFDGGMTRRRTCTVAFAARR